MGTQTTRGNKRKQEVKNFILGTSPLGLPILGFTFARSGPRVLILGGVHGDETEGTVAASSLLERLNSQTSSTALPLHMTLLPFFNIDGVLKKERTNSRGVDLNRNLPTKDWSAKFENPRYAPGIAANSEPENQALTQFIEINQPQLIISLHSWKPLLNINGDCRLIAEVLSHHTGYEIHEDIGYPTPGCLGTYCGLERNIPTLTYEIERGLEHKKVVEIHVPALMASLQAFAKSTNRL